MGKRESFRDLLAELDPMIRMLSGTSDYKKLRFTVSDMVGFFNEKLYDVWRKYEGTLPYTEIKAIAMSALYNYRGKIYRKYSREVSLEEEVVDIEMQEPPTDLLDLAKEYINDEQLFVLTLLTDPPLYIKERANLGKRIPSNLLLEYLDMETSKQDVKKMNTFRRNIFSTLETAVLSA